ncbi:MAG TPA: reactive intermediate/imine deaminase [Cytophagales bacterium]|nr:reactive intermediate/imine deaminase [Cytophagales bacterium]HAA23679.1 reactive intermediate/imine deaminase [Cytophagales bacterium]HAP59246.1 reactive intermediate/imine deaminase [Cytophagales bacterium]
MSKNVIYTPNAPAAIGPYSQAIEINGTVYVSGQIPLIPNPEDPNEKNLAVGVEAQTHQVMKNIGAILEAAKLNYNHVVKCSIFVRNMGDFATVNAAYGEYFQVDPPARETVEVSKLPYSEEVKVEISCIAVSFMAN